MCIQTFEEDELRIRSMPSNFNIHAVPISLSLDLYGLFVIVTYRKEEGKSQHCLPTVVVEEIGHCGTPEG